MNDSFGARLRRERERQHITLTQIAAATKIKASLFEGLERDDVSRWPGGIFRRSFIRAYAEAIGLNADDLCREFTTRFPESADATFTASVDPPVRRAAPPAVIAAAPAATVPVPAVPPPSIPAPPLLTMDRLADDFADLGAPPPAMALAGAADKDEDDDEPSLRLTLAEAGAPAMTMDRPAAAAARARVPSSLATPAQVAWQPLALDLGVILVVAVLAFVVSGAFWMPLALTSLVYLLGSTALLGRTAGAEFFAVTVPVAKPASAAPPPSPAAAALDRVLEIRDPMRSEPPDPAGEARIARPYTAAVRQPVDIESRRARA